MRNSLKINLLQRSHRTSFVVHRTSYFVHFPKPPYAVPNNFGLPLLLKFGGNFRSEYH
jgi:hypothetical protein